VAERRKAEIKGPCLARLKPQRTQKLDSLLNEELHEGQTIESNHGLRAGEKQMAIPG
jgi:hypothetical protein